MSELLPLVALWYREEDDTYKVARPRFNAFSTNADALYMDVTEDSNHTTRYLARQQHPALSEDEFIKVAMEVALGEGETLGGRFPTTLRYTRLGASRLYRALVAAGFINTKPTVTRDALGVPV